MVRRADSSEVENFIALVGFHGQSASCLAQGGPDGCFRFNLELRGRRSEVVVGNADPGERVQSINAAGLTLGEPEEDGAFAVRARGHATTQPDGTGSGARHFNIDLAGAGSTGSIQ